MCKQREIPPSHFATYFIEVFPLSNSESDDEKWKSKSRMNSDLDLPASSTDHHHHDHQVPWVAAAGLA